MEVEPEVDIQMALCIEAWHDLGTCRGIGMDLGPIPWTAIVSWCQWRRFDYEATQLMVAVIRKLDNDRAEREAAKRRLDKLSGK